MVTKPEFTAASLEAIAAAKTVEQELLYALEGATSITKALDVAKSYGVSYYEGFDDLMDQTLKDAALSSSNYYNKHYALGLSDDELRDYSYQLIDDLKNEKYHGLNHKQRKTLLQLALNKRFAKSSSVGLTIDQKLKNISRALTKPYPFGAQVNLDRRFLLSEVVRVEHKIARDLAARAGIPLIRWNLSGGHSQVDICDEYAGAVSKDVIIFLQENGREDEDPRGLYFIDEVPSIPHPNCQCELSGVGIKETFLSRPQTRRSIQKVMELMQKILRK